MPYSREDLIKHLRELKNELGEAPTSSDMNEAEGRPHSQTFSKRFGCWNDSLKQAGIQPQESPNSKYDRESLLNHIKKLEDEMGKTPTMVDMENAEDRPSVTAYRNRFECWNNAVESAGLRPNGNYTKEELISELKELAEELGHSPTKTEIEAAENRPSCSSYQRNFSCWNEALKSANLELNGNYTKDVLLNHIENLADRLGHIPTGQEMNMCEYGPSSQAPYERQFGSWNEALREAGFNPEDKPEYERVELIQQIQDFKESNGRPPVKSDFELSEEKASIHTFQERFGSWHNAIREAGQEPHINRVPVVYDSEELVTHIKELADEIGRTPTVKDMDEADERPSYSSFNSRFGGWNKALDSAGFEPNRYEMCRDELIRQIQELANELGRRPTLSDMNSDDKRPYDDAFYNEFESWNDALEKAGFETSEETSIETQVRDIIEETDVTFEQQKELPEWNGCVDFYITHQDIVVEADGNYWHGHPDTRPYDKIQKEGIQRDMRKDDAHSSAGRVVIRIWEKTINERIDSVRAHLTDIIEGDANIEKGQVNRLCELYGLAG